MHDFTDKTISIDGKLLISIYKYYISKALQILFQDLLKIEGENQ